MTPPTFILSLVLFWSKICWSTQETANIQEEQTRILNKLLEKYDHRIIPYNNNRTDGFDYVSITVNWLLLHISGVSDYDMDFSIQIMFNLEWTDGRLKYENTGKIEYLTLTDTSKVWVPDIFFGNEKDGHQHRLTAPNTFYRIYPSGKVVYSTRLSLTMSCYMHLENFPFDSQICSVRIASYAYVTKDYVLFWKEDSPIAVSKEVGRVMGFTMSKFLTSVCHSKTYTGEYTCLKAEFFFKRNLEYYVLHTFLPTALLVIVSWASFWIDRRQIVARILLVLSTLFAMSSFSTDIDSSVPNVPYVKAMDVWVGTCFIFLLLALLEFGVISSIGSSEDNADSKAEEGSVHVVQNANSSQDSEPQGKSLPKAASFRVPKTLLHHLPKDSRRIDLTARILFPAAFFTFVFTYVLIYYMFDDPELN